MADPIGAPTLAQMFSPMKSPFHALSLVSLICITAIFKEPLANFGIGLMLTVVVGSFFLALFFRPSYSDRVHGLSLMFARSAGLIGAMIALSILIAKSRPAGDGVTGLTPNTEIFRLLWLGIVLQSLYMGALFLHKTVERRTDCKRFNIIQFSLMQSTLLIFIVILAASSPEFSWHVSRDMVIEGGGTLIRAPFQIFSHEPVPPPSVTLALMLVWCLSAIANALCMMPCVVLGWIGDHGVGEHS